MATNDELAKEVSDLQEELDLVQHILVRFAENLDLINRKLGFSVDEVIATRGLLKGMGGGDPG